MLKHKPETDQQRQREHGIEKGFPHPGRGAAVQENPVRQHQREQQPGARRIAVGPLRGPRPAAQARQIQDRDGRAVQQVDQRYGEQHPGVQKAGEIALYLVGLADERDARADGKGQESGAGLAPGH